MVVDDDEIIKVHVHTEDPGNALQAGLEFGSLLTVKVENMKEQHKAAKENEQEKQKHIKKKEKLAEAAPEEEIGFVAVAAGEGLSELFKDLGCSHVVSGGQSMNPSTDDILEAVMATGAKTVFVLPNNKTLLWLRSRSYRLSRTGRSSCFQPGRFRRGFPQCLPTTRTLRRTATNSLCLTLLRA